MYMVMAVCWTIGWKLVLSKVLDKLREYSNKAVKSLSKLAKKVKQSFHKKLFLKAALMLKSKKKGVQKGKKDILRKDPDEDSTEQERLDRVLLIHHQFPEKLYHNINQEIDFQVQELQAYKASEDYNQELFDYLEIFNVHSFLALFGVLFPIVFVIGLGITFAEWKMDMHDLIRGTKRPVPVETGTIGVWLNMLKLVSLFSALTNTFFVAFILFEQSSYYDKLGLFLVSSIGLLGMLFVWDHQYKAEGLGSFISRRASYIKQFLNERLEKRLQLSTESANIPLKKDVAKDMRIFGKPMEGDHRGVNISKLSEETDKQIEHDQQEKILKAKMELLYEEIKDYKAKLGEHTNPYMPESSLPIAEPSPVASLKPQPVDAS